MNQRFQDIIRSLSHAYDLECFLHVLQSRLMAPSISRNLRLLPQVVDSGLLLLRQHRALLLHIIVERCDFARALIC